MTGDDPHRGCISGRGRARQDATFWWCLGVLHMQAAQYLGQGYYHGGLAAQEDRFQQHVQLSCTQLQEGVGLHLTTWFSKLPLPSGHSGSYGAA